MSGPKVLIPLDVLKRIQWQLACVDYDKDFCPECAGSKPNHQPGCELESALKFGETIHACDSCGCESCVIGWAESHAFTRGLIEGAAQERSNIADYLRDDVDQYANNAVPNAAEKIDLNTYMKVKK